MPESAFLQTTHAPETVAPWTEMGFERLILVSISENQPTSSANCGLSVSAVIFLLGSAGSEQLLIQQIKSTVI